MRERSLTTPRRRGPKLPPPRDTSYNEQFETSEPPYYSINNTEDIYGTTLSPTQRCYVDPWDLENYDYVRRKLEPAPTPRSYYESSLSPSPPGREVAAVVPPRMAATMPRNNRRRSQLPCEMECCVPTLPRRSPSGGGGSGFYGAGNRNVYEDYMWRQNELAEIDDMDQNIYNGYGGDFSSSSSTERHSSIEDETPPSALLLHTTRPYGGARAAEGIRSPHRRSMIYHPPPSIPAPALSPTYDYCNPYATLPYCSVSDCYECLYGSTLCRRPSSSIYGGLYASNKFGLSKKGLLQIDYSCSWNDLDRVMRQNC